MAPQQLVSKERGSAVHKLYWTSQEDQQLRRLVQMHGARNWSRIAKSFKGRVGKQCRERWRNHLNPDICKEPFSAQEDAKIIRLVDELGTRWTKIASRLPGRTDNSIKNRYYSALKRVHDERNSARMDDDEGHVATVPASPEHHPLDAAAPPKLPLPSPPSLSCQQDAFRAAPPLSLNGDGSSSSNNNNNNSNSNNHTDHDSDPPSDQAPQPVAACPRAVSAPSAALLAEEVRRLCPVASDVDVVWSAVMGLFTMGRHGSVLAVSE